MTQASSRSQSSLARLLSLRLAATSLMAIFLQIGITAVRSYLDETDLGTNYVKYEARLLAAQSRAADDPLLRSTALPPARYRNEYKDAYSFRILAADGKILAQHNGALLAA